jgi:hypothetical protein
MLVRESLAVTVRLRVWLAIVALLAAASLGIGTAEADAFSFAWAAPAIGSAPIISSASRGVALVGAVAAPLAADASPPSYEQTVLADAPSAYFRLADDGTVVADVSGHGHDGSLPSGASHPQPGALVGDADRALQVDEDHALTVASDGLPGLSAAAPSSGITRESRSRGDRRARMGRMTSVLGRVRFRGSGRAPPDWTSNRLTHANVSRSAASEPPERAPTMAGAVITDNSCPSPRSPKLAGGVKPG